MQANKYNVWFLMEIAESTKAPEHDEKYFHEDVTFDAKGGWKCIMFYDGDELDYIDSFITPEGEIVNFWDWEESAEKDLLTCWRSIGDLERLKKIAAQKSVEGDLQQHTTQAIRQPEEPASACA